MRYTYCFLLAVSVAACGTDICDRASKVTNDINARETPCQTSASVTSTTINVTQCKADEKNCNDNDVKLFNAYLDCADNTPAPVCSSGTSDQDKQTALTNYGVALVSCAGQLSGASKACTTAISGT